jgi:hypothetical protein
LSIENCRFKFRCEQTWDGLTPTAHEQVRHCSECREDVHFCTTDEQLAQAIRQGHCVAIPSRDDPEDYKGPVHATIGVVGPAWEDEECP